MAMFEEKFVKKVPGNVCPNPRDRQGFIENLSSKTKVELTELLERQEALLSNKFFVRKLPDKGERIEAFRERIKKALSEKDQIEQTCGLLSGLSINNANVTDEIEWTGKFTGVLNDKSSSNSSDEDTKPLKILASHAGNGRFKKKKHRHLKKRECLENSIEITDEASALKMSEEDPSEGKLEQVLEQNIVLGSGGKLYEDLYAKNLCNKVDKPQENKTVPFKPHCTTKSGMHPGLFIPKRQGPHWEVTAATPPPPVHGAAKLLTLQESLQLQQSQAANLKVIQAKHASEKLASNSTVKLGSVMPDLSVRNEYRDAQQEYDSSNSSDAEENDGQSDEDEKRDTIVYTYTE